MEIQLSPEEIHRFYEDGFLSVPKITTAEEVDSIRGLYDKLFERRAGWEKGDFFDFAGTDAPGATLSVPQMLDPSRYEPALRDTLFRRNAHAIAKQLLGSTAELVFEHAMMKPAQTGGETPWHQDYAFYPRFTKHQSITFWMPLQPVDTLNGCLDFIPGSHKKTLLPHRSVNNDPRIHGLEAIGVDDSGLVSCPLEVGGATIHHYGTLHHAGPNRSDGPRRAYALGFGIQSKDFIIREDFPWNVEKATARIRRAEESRTVLERVTRQLRQTAKAVLR